MLKAFPPGVEPLEPYYLWIYIGSPHPVAGTIGLEHLPASYARPPIQTRPTTRRARRFVSDI